MPWPIIKRSAALKQRNVEEAITVVEGSIVAWKDLSSVINKGDIDLDEQKFRIIKR